MLLYHSLRWSCPHYAARLLSAPVAADGSEPFIHNNHIHVLVNPHHPNQLSSILLSQCNRAVLFKWECLQIGYFPLTNVQSHLFMAISLTVLPLKIRVDGTSCKWESPDKRAVMQVWVLNRRATMVCMTKARLLSYQSFLLTQEYINIRM